MTVYRSTDSWFVLVAIRPGTILVSGDKFNGIIISHEDYERIVIWQKNLLVKKNLPYFFFSFFFFFFADP
jgi:hypothetical protein